MSVFIWSNRCVQGWVDGWMISGLCFMENERSRRTCGYKDREREREETPVGGRASIHCVARIFASYPISPERSRLYHSVYPLFSGTFTIRYRNTSGASLPVISPSRLLRHFSSPASGCSRSSFFSLFLSPSRSFSSSSLQCVSSSSPFTRDRLLIWNRAESISVFYRSTAASSTLLLCIFYTVIFLFCYEIRERTYPKGKGWKGLWFKSLFSSGNLNICYCASVRLTSWPRQLICHEINI